MTRRKKPLADSLLEKIRTDETTGCWIWTAGKTRGGYGQINTVHVRGTRAHRVVYELLWGPIPKGLHVCHRCDNPVCVNPEHMFLGTNADNVSDKIFKGRQLRGTTHGRAKLAESDVLAIRAASGITQDKLAQQFGVSQDTISLIRTGKRWAHLSTT